jgi:four helix bundle protein
MKEGRLFELTAEAAGATIGLVASLPDRLVLRRIAAQLIDSGTSPAANYRAARRARSPADFVAKMKIVEEEADESMGWLEHFRTAGLAQPQAAEVERLYAMFNEIVAMTVASIKTTRRRHLGPGKRHRR